VTGMSLTESRDSDGRERHCGDKSGSLNTQA
jgi:hypothetical protein